MDTITAKVERQMDPPKDLLVFQVGREITGLSKHFLVILEDLKNVEQVISNDDYLRLRKKVLDSMNDTVRNLHGLIDSLEVKMKGSL